MKLEFSFQYFIYILFIKIVYINILQTHKIHKIRFVSDFQKKGFLVCLQLLSAVFLIFFMFFLSRILISTEFPCQL